MSATDIDDPELSICRLLQAWPETAPVFLGHGMLCVGCEIAPFHTVADACAEYRLDEAAFRAELRRAAGAQARPTPGLR